jgi:agmatinase
MTTNGAPFSIAGIPFDLGTTNRAGARDGPNAIRRASRMLHDGLHPVTGFDFSNAPIADAGNLELVLGDLTGSLNAIEKQARLFSHLIALGGDHSITLPLLRAAHERHGCLSLIHFDAHVDTWPDSFGQPFGHGSPFYHAIVDGLVDPKRTIQIGIRSPVCRDVRDWTSTQGVTGVDSETVHLEGPAAIAAKICDLVGSTNTYLSFDIDALDPAFAPGTGTPEVGGLATWQAIAILRRLNGVNFVGMDVVEVAPAYDVAEITALAAATMVCEYLSIASSQA